MKSIRMENRALVLRVSDFLEAVHSTVLQAKLTPTTEKYESSFTSAVGHFLRFGPSTIPEAGDGTFLFNGQVSRGGIVTLFPGLVRAATAAAAGGHQASAGVRDDSSSKSSRNPYILRDSFQYVDYVIDGRPNGPSALEFVDAVQNAKEQGSVGVPVNHSWVDEPGVGLPDCTPLHHIPSAKHKGGATMGSFASRVAFQEALLQCSLGHKINRPGEGNQENVTFQLVSLPKDFPDDLLQYVPMLGGRGNGTGGNEGGDRWAVVVQAMQDLDVKRDGPMELFMNF